MLVGGWSWGNQGPLTNLYFVFHFDSAADVGESFKEYTPSVQVANQGVVESLGSSLCGCAFSQHAS